MNSRACHQPAASVAGVLVAGLLRAVDGGADGQGAIHCGGSLLLELAQLRQLAEVAGATFCCGELVANAAHQALARSAHWGRTNVNTSRLYGSAWLAWGHRHLEPRASVGALFETAQSDSDIDLTIQTITWG